MARPARSVRFAHNVASGVYAARVTDISHVDDYDKLLTPAEVAAMFRVNPKTVTRWARAGKISAIRTLGGHRRFRESEIRALLERVEAGDA